MRRLALVFLLLPLILLFVATCGVPPSAPTDSGMDAGEDGGSDSATDAGGDGGWDAGPQETMDAGGDGGFVDAGMSDGGDAGFEWDAGRAEDGGVFIQDVQDGTIPAGTLVSLQGVFVTAARGGAGLNSTLFVQEPQGVSPTRHNYPEYAGLAVFLTAAESTARGGIPSIGDCVDVSGLVSEFAGQTQLTNPTLTPRIPGECGTPPTPIVTVPLDDVASDTNRTMAGYQPGPRAEQFEGVLLQLHNVQVVGARDSFGEFPIASQSATAGPIVNVNDFFYTFSVTLNQTYTAVRGIYVNTANAYKLEPRSAADLQ